LGSIRLKERTLGRVKGSILSATVSRVADRWFVSITILEKNHPDSIHVSGPAVGVDLGIKTFAVCSDGQRFESPRALQRALAKLRRAQHAHSRKVKGSRNRRKSAQKIARIHARVANVRRDFLHKTTTRLAKTKSIIVIEDLKVKGMIKNRSLSQSIMDAGWGEFRRQLGYKTTWYGSKLMVADRWFPSSKRCSDCGHILKRLALSLREWACPQCGVVHDRDGNASINLELLTYPEFRGNVDHNQIRKPVESPLTAELVKTRSTSYGSLKQEMNIEVGLCQP
jgi:putative transposase